MHLRVFSLTNVKISRPTCQPIPRVQFPVAATSLPIIYTLIYCRYLMVSCPHLFGDWVNHVGGNVGTPCTLAKCQLGRSESLPPVGATHEGAWLQTKRSTHDQTYTYTHDHPKKSASTTWAKKGGNDGRLHPKKAKRMPKHTTRRQLYDDFAGNSQPCDSWLEPKGLRCSC